VSASSPRPGPSWPLLAGTALWLMLVCAGMSVLLEFAGTPGDAGDPPPHWPSASRLPPPIALPALVMLAHPRCPCTRASIGELALLMARVHEKVAGYVLFIEPPGVGDDWAQTDLWRSASAIPGVSVLIDRGGAEARLFHAETSGQTLLYGAGGDLLFSGGITEARSHSGDNEGRSAIVEFIDKGHSELKRHSVFGCALFSAGGAGRS
jgi:hypothetical protein